MCLFLSSMKSCHSRYTSKTFVFNRWSRSSYAIFNSLSKVVNIGRMRIDMLPAADLKSKTFLEIKSFIANLLPETDEDDGEFNPLEEKTSFHCLPIVVPCPLAGKNHKTSLAYILLLLTRSTGEVCFYDLKNLTA